MARAMALARVNASAQMQTIVRSTKRRNGTLVLSRGDDDTPHDASKICMRDHSASMSRESISNREENSSRPASTTVVSSSRSARTTMRRATKYHRRSVPFDPDCSASRHRSWALKQKKPPDLLRRLFLSRAAYLLCVSTCCSGSFGGGGRRSRR